MRRTDTVSYVADSHMIFLVVSDTAEFIHPIMPAMAIGQCVSAITISSSVSSYSTPLSAIILSHFFANRTVIFPDILSASNACIG